MFRRAKIVATLGPASQSPEIMSSLIHAGLDVARINMSHGTHEQHAQVIKQLREVSQGIGKEIGILLDLQGPKIRVDKLVKPLELHSGERWAICHSSQIESVEKYNQAHSHSIEKKVKGVIPTLIREIFTDLRVGARILFDDGLLLATAIEQTEDFFIIEVQVGGILKSNKGINLPDVEVSVPSFTQKDKKDLLFGLKMGVDFVAISFVRKAEEVREVRSLIHELRLEIPVISKIERPHAVERIESIIDASSAIMIARGDMGVEVGNHLVPAIQKRIISLCNDKGVPVITATQMLESMIVNPSPTRAEASDVANAIWDGTDAVMLSGETASGSYPVEAIKMMSSIIIEAEKNPKERGLLRHMNLFSIRAATMVAASLIAEKIKATHIVSITQSGNSCLKISRFRPVNPVLGVTFDLATVRRMALYWGITPYFFPFDQEKDQNLESTLVAKISQEFKLKNGDKLVITRGDGKFFSSEDMYSVRVEILKNIPSDQKKKNESLQIIKLENNRGQISLDTDICASCQNCVNICPQQIWKIRDSLDNETYLDKEVANKCTLDFLCMESCPTGAIEVLKFGE